jgi:formylglycine-generating enzyme required for sulfatase activity
MTAQIKYISRKLIFALLTLAAASTYAQPLVPFRDCEGCPAMVVIPAGSFLMGADKEFEVASDDETPRHSITIAHPFALAQFEVTQEEWVAVMGHNPSYFKSHQRPVAHVSWDDVQDYLKRLNAKTGMNYRLPTEAEWEYAARAGGEAAYGFPGGTRYAERYAWYEGNTDRKTRPVGELLPNPWGLYDIFGNVWEWVEDCWHANYNGAPEDGSAWVAGECSMRVARGGSWYNKVEFLRTANRYASEAASRSDSIGFRVARSIIVK